MSGLYEIAKGMISFSFYGIQHSRFAKSMNLISFSD